MSPSSANYIRSIKELLRKLPAYTKWFCGLVGFVSCLSWISGAFFEDSYYIPFTLKAGAFFYRPWTLFTYPLVERNILTLIGTLLSVAASGSLFEPQWGRVELLRFMLIVNVFSGLAYSVLYVLLYFITGNLLLIMDREARGLSALVASFAVCFKQTYPEHKVKLFGMFGFKLKQLPSYLLLVITILGLIFTTLMNDMVLCWAAVFISWCYLRFFKTQDMVRGDRSETFSFVSFFPTALRPAIKIFSNCVFSLLVQLHCCQPIHSISTSDLESGQYYIRTSTSTITGSQASPAADVERKRALALKALDERLKLAPVTEIISPGTPTASSSNNPSGR